LAAVPDPPLDGRRAGQGTFEEVVAWTEGVERQCAVRQQILPPFDRQADSIGKHLQRITFGEIGHGVESSSGDEFVGECFGLGPECLPESTDGARRNHLPHRTPGHGVVRRIGLEQQTRRPPGLFLVEVGQSCAATGAECLVVGQRGIHLRVPSHGPNPVALEVNHGAGLA
jgi:hypothetical protein